MRKVLLGAFLFAIFSTTAFAAHTIDVMVDDGEAITITGSNNVISVDDAANNCDTPLSATLTAGTYTPTELAAEITTQLSATLTDNAAAVYNYETRLFTIVGDTDGDSICWADVSDTAHTILGYGAVNDIDIDTTPAVQDTAFSIGDRAYQTSSAGSDSILLEMEIDVSGGADNVDILTVTPPTGWTITGWNLFNMDDGDDAADATDTPNMDGNAGNTTGCGDINSTTTDTAGITNCSAEVTGNGSDTLSLDLETVVASGQTVVLQLWVDASATAAVSGTWTIQTTDDNVSPVSTSETFNLVAADVGDIVFETYELGDPLDGDVSQAASGGSYIFGADDANMFFSDFSGIKKTLSTGVGLYEAGTDFDVSGTADGTFDYLVTGTGESASGDNYVYTYDGLTVVKAARTVDVTGPAISGVIVGKSSSYNWIKFTLTEPLIYDSLITDADNSIASTSGFGDTTSTNTGLVFSGIGEWTDSDGQPNTTGKTGANTVSINASLLQVTINTNNESTADNIFYYTNIVDGVAADGTNDDFTPIAGAIVDAAGNALDTAAIGTGAITVNSSWEVTAPAVPQSFQRNGIVSSSSENFSWQSIADPGDFRSYLFLYSTSDITPAATATQWNEGDDANLTTLGTVSTTVTGLTTGVTNKYRLGAVDDYGNIALSTQIQSTVGAGGSGGAVSDLLGPAAPTAFSASLDSNLDVVLSWTDPTDLDLDKIHVYKSTNGTDFSLSGVVNPVLETYTDDVVTEGEVVSYKIVGTDLSGNQGTFSNVVEVTVSADKVGQAIVAEDVVVETTTTEETATTTTTTVVDGTPAFPDIQGHWAEAEINAMAAHQIVRGIPNGDFIPDGNLNRAEAAALLYRVLGFEDPVAPAEKPFPDVEVDSWYGGYVNELLARELINGNPDGTYSPVEKINRAEFLTLAMNVYYYLADPATQTIIDDAKGGAMTDAYVDLEDTWYSPTVTAATELGFVHGSICEGGRCFKASNEITRAEATVILYNMFIDILDEAAAAALVQEVTTV